MKLKCEILLKMGLCGFNLAKNTEKKAFRMIFWLNLRFYAFIFNDLINAFDFPINFS